MATQPTNNAVPSESPRDLKFNAGKIDEFVTSQGWTYSDRFGVKHYTIEGINHLAQQVMSAFGYVALNGVTFTTGATVSNPNEVLFNTADNSYYKWTGSFASGAKVVPPNSTPESSGGVGPGKWINVGDSALRSDLANGGGASLVKYKDSTVEEALDALEDKAGFNAVGRFLNLSELRSAAPASAGIIVYVSSAASTTHAESHVGGGYFESVDNTQAWPDDGGVVIKPATGTIVWKRINFTQYDMQFWGVKADGVTDNAAAITKATNYARDNRIILMAPEGSINTSEMVPIYDYMGICGRGKSEATVFYKTTNNAFEFKKGGVTVYTLDALVGFVAPEFDRASFNMTSFVQHGRLENCMFRRQDLNVNNVGKIRPEVGLFLNKAGACVLRGLTVEGGYIGMKWFNAFSTIMEAVYTKTIAGYGYAGIQAQDYRNGIYYMSGTSNDMRLVQTSGYQYGFDIARLQYTTMTNCTCEVMKALPGEGTCYAFNFIDPYSIVMNTCATEEVEGGQISVRSSLDPSFARSLVISGYLPIGQQSGPTPTPMFYVDGGGLPGSLGVTFIGGDLSRDTRAINNGRPVVSGANTKVVIINSTGEDWQQLSGGTFTRLA
ncbi:MULTISPECIES: phage tail protein [unclassified Cedecea]|uniref:tail fiber/spike domain-containing protein n=1 Tax=unclassified Cedecea TaxID=2649846 RepID=UPI003018EE41